MTIKKERRKLLVFWLGIASLCFTVTFYFSVRSFTNSLVKQAEVKKERIYIRMSRIQGRFFFKSEIASWLFEEMQTPNKLDSRYLATILSLFHGNTFEGITIKDQEFNSLYNYYHKSPENLMKFLNKKVFKELIKNSNKIYIGKVLHSNLTNDTIIPLMNRIEDKNGNLILYIISGVNTKKFTEGITTEFLEEINFNFESNEEQLKNYEKLLANPKIFFLLEIMLGRKDYTEMSFRAKPWPINVIFKYNNHKIRDYFLFECFIPYAGTSILTVIVLALMFNYFIFNPLIH